MRTLASIAAVACAAALAAPGPAGAEDLYATFDTSAGTIVAKLLPQKAPKAVKNFVELAEGKKEWSDPQSGKKVKKPLYDGTLFHRVIPGFMIQGGDPLTQGQKVGSQTGAVGRFGTGGPGFEFEDELEKGGHPFAKPCQLAMANHGANTNGSQFFITEVPTPHLDPRPCDSATGVCGYTHFGEGICGCDLVSKIARAGNTSTVLNKVTITRGKAPACK